LNKLAAFLLIVAIGAVAIIIVSRIEDRHQIVRPLTVGDLLDHGANYDGRVVTVRGEVITGAGLLTVGGYRLGDSTGHREIVVLTDTGVPPLHNQVTVTGMYKQAVTFGEFRYGAIVPPGWCDDTKWRYLPGQLFAILCRASGSST
jgi:hypothetical protein